jgi:uncharacterized membrane protein YbhN (UPF0104 family)
LTPARRRLFTALQVLFALAVIWYAGRTLIERWSEFQQAPVSVQPRWEWIIPASVIVLMAYLLLIHVWVAHLRVWGVRLRFAVGARLWFISNLGRYVPGKVWGIGTLVVMAKRRSISPVAAVGSSLLVMLIGIVAGLAVVLVTGTGAVELALAQRGVDVAAWVVPAAAIASLGSLIAAPAVVPRLAHWVGRATGEEPALPTLPAAAVWVVALGTGLSWILYGLAFQLFSTGMTGDVGGPATSYIAVYTAAYLIGLVSPSPAGAGVRESGLVAGLLALGLATAPQALLIALASRVWLTVLEVAPGAIFLLLRSEEQPREPEPASHGR